MKRDEKIGPGYEEAIDAKKELANLVKEVEEHFDKMDKKRPEKGRDIEPAYSMNNRLIVEPYQTDGGLKSNVKNGFATVQQKIGIVGLRLLMDARLTDGKQTSTILRKGTRVYIREEVLHTQAWAKARYESDAVEGPFMIVDASFVEFIGQV